MNRQDAKGAKTGERGEEKRREKSKNVKFLNY
jgi:hypothetical protein